MINLWKSLAKMNKMFLFSLFVLLLRKFLELLSIIIEAKSKNKPLKEFGSFWKQNLLNKQYQEINSGSL